MDDKILRHFYYEIRLQCMFCKYAYEDIQRLVHTGSNQRVFYSIQAFLVSFANISKIMFPVMWSKDKPAIKARKQERGKVIRKNLNVHENSILHDRKFRDHFEHYDERIDEWYASNSDKVFVDLYMGSMERLRFSFRGVEPDGVHRHFDPESETATFRGQQYELKPAIAEVNRLYGEVLQLIGEPF